MKIRQTVCWSAVGLAAVVGPLCGAVDFQFSYSDAGTGFNDPVLGADRRSALESASTILASYFSSYTAVLDITVSSYSQATLILASGGSPTSSTDGFQGTIMQRKVLNGGDPNGGSADGTLSFNFSHSWNYADAVDGSSYDFKSVAMHELLHGLGFFSYIQATGQGAKSRPAGDSDTWTVFDRHLTTGAGERLVGDDFRYNLAVGTAVLTGDPGVFFSGPSAMAAYGGRVPIFSPSLFELGSSLGHVDQLSSGELGFLMNPSTGLGPGPRVFTSVEIGILRDLGYTAVPEVGVWGTAGAVGLVVFAGCRRRRTGEDGIGDRVG